VENRAGSVKSRGVVRPYYTVLRLYVLYMNYFTAVLFRTYFWLESVRPYVLWGKNTAVCTGYTLLATLSYRKQSFGTILCSRRYLYKVSI
jgi:hypothetical protein